MTDAGRPRGFSLVEMLIVLAVMSFLLLVAVPAFNEQVRKTHRTLARAELQKLVLRQERFFTEHHIYAETLSELGFPGDSYVLTSDGNAASQNNRQGIYLVSMESRGSTYLVRTSPLGSDGRCGTLTLDGIGGRGASGRAGVSGCW